MQSADCTVQSADCARFPDCMEQQHKTCLLLVVSGSRIRSLLVGSGTQSVSAFSYMQDVDINAAQKALRRHKSAVELARGMPKPSNRYLVNEKEGKKACVCMCVYVCVWGGGGVGGCGCGCVFLLISCPISCVEGCKVMSTMVTHL